MRIPWKLIRQRGIWMMLSLFLILAIVNNLSYTASYHSSLLRDNVLKRIQNFRLYDQNSDSLNSDKSENHPAVPKEEVQHIAFLKVHKAASSTAQNIFLRFGWKRNSTFVLAPAKNPSGYPNIISLRESLTNSNILPPPKGRHYDILCNHVFYTREAFSHFMPNDTMFIGIIREPFELYKSILNYFRPRYIFKKIEGPNPASTFLRNPAKYEPPGKVSSSWTNSRMAIEYGFPEKLFKRYNQTEVDEYLGKLDNEFSLVLISEYFEESVVLMRRILNWHTSDILFLKQNVARHKNETALYKAFDRDFYKRYAKLDYALYNFFYRRLREKIRVEGADFDDELLAYKELRKRVEEYCAQTQVLSPMLVPRTPWGREFQVNRNDCSEMKRGEIEFITRIRIRQYGSKNI